MAPQASDLKLSIRGSAIVKPEVAENEDGSLQITYTVGATPPAACMLDTGDADAVVQHGAPPCAARAVAASSLGSGPVTMASMLRRRQCRASTRSPCRSGRRRLAAAPTGCPASSRAPAMQSPRWTCGTATALWTSRTPLSSPCATSSAAGRAKMERSCLHGMLAELHMSRADPKAASLQRCCAFLRFCAASRSGRR